MWGKYWNFKAMEDTSKPVLGFKKGLFPIRDRVNITPASPRRLSRGEADT